MIYIVFLLISVFSIFALIYGPKASFILTGFGVFLSSFYLIYDTQLILSGTFEGHRRFQLDEDSYIMGALILYLDIINLFLYILKLLGENKD